MRVLPISIAIAILMQPKAAKPIAAATARCVGTAPMPVVKLSSRDPMPVLRPDMSRLEHMPLALLRPCYLADSATNRTPLP